MRRHQHTINQTKCKVKQTQTELKKKQQNQSKVFCKQGVMRFLWNFIHRDLTMTATLKNNNKHQCFDHHHFPKSQWMGLLSADGGANFKARRPRYWQPLDNFLPLHFSSLKFRYCSTDIVNHWMTFCGTFLLFKVQITFCVTLLLFEVQLTSYVTFIQKYSYCQPLDNFMLLNFSWKTFIWPNCSALRLLLVCRAGVGCVGRMDQELGRR